MSMGTNQANAASAASRRGWRKWHGWIGLLSAVPMLITAVCGGLLLFRKVGLYERRGPFRDAIQALHSYEILLPYVGLVAVLLMIATTITGAVVFVQMRRRR
ncbi:MAG: hypothetical protein RBS72_04390 [Sedimentisphaerales bacterium]|nr:hypothetical protein [Sedimentisphaerales bacterium]NLZ03818.1 hypothetical protein [Phycisphaerae bacterium]HNY77596.1 hypothetical protein [Sedimentisphaerales bacterium]HOC61929.1 hypothetical protein [Sedimentisphaerales bacterium]HOH63771.1 hypothetical protein [Sedimentisphaerales bacterium]